MLRKLHFSEGWRFQLEDGESLVEARQKGFNDSAWRRVNLPHDWSIELDFNPESASTHEGGYLDGGIGWYRKTFALPQWTAGKKLSIDFEGVYMNSTVYLNGEVLGTYPYGYNAFTYDITDKVFTDGRENVLTVRVENIQPSSRWYSGSGIYRNVYLTVTNVVHVDRYGTFVTSPDLEEELKQNRACVSLKTKVKNDSKDQSSVTVKSVIYDGDGNVVATSETEDMVIESGAIGQFEDRAYIHNPKLWSTSEDNRYRLVTEVVADGQLMDVYETKFGLRYFSFDSNEGFSLNGQYMKLHGVCMHHDLGALGAAVNDRAVERQMQIMKDMGVNAIRVTHNPAAPELIEICNRLGLLVIEETFDTWNLSKKEYDYGRFFAQWAEHDTKEMVDRNKNEPSIIMWSIGNEIYDTTSPEGVEIVRSLVKWVKEIDTTRPTTIGEDKTRGDKVSVTPLNEHIEAIFNEVDVVGLNYSENNYLGYHEQHPEWKIYGSETSSATRSRGVYTHSYEYNMSTTYDDRQQSSYDNDFVAWGRTAEDAWIHDRDSKHIAGQFIWTGFDYIGEPTPYYNAFPSKSSYFGAVDTAGFPKDIYYYYQSQWSQKKVVHILPHWNWSEGETVRVLVYTNARKAELQLNGKSLGERSFEAKTTSWGKVYLETTDGKTYLEWSVPFEKGTLTAIAKDEHGQVIGEASVKSAGEPLAIRLTADRGQINADGRDLAFITADIVDHEGNIVPTADHLIEFSVSGKGILAGVDNGDAASIERYKDNKRSAFNGKALAIVQALKESGECVLQASSAGLTGSSVVISTKDQEPLTKLISVDITASQTKLNVNETVDLGVIGTFSHGELAELPQAVSITYEIDSSAAEIKNGRLLAAAEGQACVTATITYGDFVMTTPKLSFHIRTDSGEGASDSANLTADKETVVRTAIALEQVSMAVLKNRQPHLPESVTVYFNDGTEERQEVQWDEISAERLQTASEFEIEGIVAGVDMRAKAWIRVTEEFGVMHNISRAKNGYDYPKAEASYEYSGVGSVNRVEVIHDDVISYEEYPNNRWTNQSEAARSSDWISITFGDYGPVEYVVDQVELHWYEDRDCSSPASLKISYMQGSEWVEVTNMQSPLAVVSKQPNAYTFDPVRTSAIRIDMTAKPGKAIGVTEVKIFDKLPKAHTEVKVSDILLDGKSIIGDFVTKPGAIHECVVKLESGAKVPVINGAGIDNTSITVVPAASPSSPARLIARSEDGKKTAEYRVYFKI